MKRGRRRRRRRRGRAPLSPAPLLGAGRRRRRHRRRRRRLASPCRPFPCPCPWRRRRRRRQRRRRCWRASRPIPTGARRAAGPGRPPAFSVCSAHACACVCENSVWFGLFWFGLVLSFTQHTHTHVRARLACHSPAHQRPSSLSPFPLPHLLHPLGHLHVPQPPPVVARQRQHQQHQLHRRLARVQRPCSSAGGDGDGGGLLLGHGWGGGCRCLFSAFSLACGGGSRG
jgi:hypothetical protein